MILTGIISNAIYPFAARQDTAKEKNKMKCAT
jgi:hypothetical protein